MVSVCVSTEFPCNLFKLLLLTHGKTDGSRTNFEADSLALVTELLLYTIVPPALLTLILLLFVLLLLLFKIFWNTCCSLAVIGVPCGLSPINQPPANGLTAGGWCTCTSDWLICDWLTTELAPCDCIVFKFTFDVVNVVVPPTWFPANDVTYIDELSVKNL